MLIAQWPSKQFRQIYGLPGIYSITNLVNGHKYIGSARNIYKRFCQHISALKNGKHHNKHLQSAWNKYGHENFIFQGICDCDILDLVVYEQYMLDSQKPEYNICKIAGTTGSVVLSEEHKKKLSLAKIGKAQKEFPDVKIESPDGGVVVGIKNLRLFCEQNGLDSSHMSKVISGKRLSHRGWKLC